MFNPIKKYDKVLNKVKVKAERKPLKSKLKALLGWALKPFSLLYSHFVKPLNHLPNGLYFMLFLAFVFVLFGFFIGHERKVQNAFISQTCPSMINAYDYQGNLIKVSPYDQFITEFNSTFQAVMFTMFGFMFWTLFALLWRSENPEKPQVFRQG